MRVRDIGRAHERLLRGLTGRISKALVGEFSETDADGPNVGIRLRERGRLVTMEVPAALLFQAVEDTAAREAVRVRIKACRDRMLFRPPPAPLPRHVAPAAAPGGFFVPGHGGGRRGRR